MKRLKEQFLDKVQNTVSLTEKDILEIGCGNGERSKELAARCRELTAIEPNFELIEKAKQRNIPNAFFQIGTAEKLEFKNKSFDMVVFTLSLHHVPIPKMKVVIDEAVRVLKPNGHVVFLEPTEDGTFFDAEVQFDACDGDERKEKIAAYQAMISNKNLTLIKEMDDETIFQFDSLADFMESMLPKKNVRGIETFLEVNNYTLRAGRRVNIFAKGQ